MATSQDYLTSLQNYHPGINISSIPGITDEANQAASQGVDTNSYLSRYQNDPRIVGAYRQKQDTLFAPTIAGINTQVGNLQSGMQLSDQNYGNQVNSQNNTFDNSEYQIKQDQLNQNSGLLNQADQMGLATSGVTAAGTGRIAANTSKQLSFTEANRANTLAQLAIQNNQNKNQLQGTIAQLETQKAATNQQAGTAAQQEFLQNSQDQFGRALSLYNASSSLPTGRSVSIAPGYTVVGTQQLPTQALQLFSNLNYSLLGDTGYQNLIKNAFQGMGYNIDTSDLDAWGKKYASAPVSSAPAATGGGGYTAPKPASPVPSAPQAGPSTPAGYTPNTLGVSPGMWGQAAPALQDIFTRGGWQGHDQTIMDGLKAKYGLNDQQASYLYYKIRKQAIGQ